MSVTVEDVDPFRDCQAWAAAGRLAPAAWKAWRLALAAAARQLAAELPAYASVIGAGLRSVVPMRPGAAGIARAGRRGRPSGRWRWPSPMTSSMLSELLVHEMQHVKLTALCDLFDLFDRADDTLFAVPWRDDRRPLEGLLHGTYAHLAVAELWRSRSRQTPEGEARRLFLIYRSWVEEAIEALLRCGQPDAGRVSVSSTACAQRSRRGPMTGEVTPRPAAARPRRPRSAGGGSPVARPAARSGSAHPLFSPAGRPHRRRRRHPAGRDPGRSGSGGDARGPDPDHA